MIVLLVLFLLSSFSTYAMDPKKLIPGVVVGYSGRCGERASNEDTYVINETFGKKKNEKLFGVFDGHYGKLAAVWASQNLPQTISGMQAETIKEKLLKAFRITNNNLYSINCESGTSALVAWFQQNNLHIAHAGDTRGVLVKNGKVEFETRDHRWSNPKENVRIESLLQNKKLQQEYGKAYFNGKVLVTRAGQHESSRSLGDAPWGDYIISDPNVKTIQLTPQHNFLILACDGVWDVMKNNEVVTFVTQAFSQSKEKLKERYLKYPIVDRGPKKRTPDFIHEAGDEKVKLVARALRDEAYKRGSKDNISVLIAKFLWDKKDKQSK